MSNYLGEYEVTLDPKGRFMVPVGFKRQLPEAESVRFVLNRGLDKCITLYTVSQWEEVSVVVKKLNEFNEKARIFKRTFLNGATFMEPDSAGRLLLPKSMLEYAGIKKDMVFSVQMNKVEIWDAPTFRALSENVDMNTLAGEVLGGNYLNPFERI
ncbi:MAG: division/cell wall cluster transcriptional repressor MraZ [Chitinophagaceae bacterium]|nr:division/cell wall cluster transcriptional repressor MraZ [Chitinophagaceae bacterium]